ncbi:MAG: chorismate mutase [Actinomycetota bacterium]
MRIRGVRGAITVEQDIKETVIAATVTLLQEILDRNEIAKEDLVSLIFTATPDIRSEFPAAAAREIGISDIPLLCASEIDVEGAIPRCIRVLAHVYTERDYASLRHVYLGKARQLRTDLPE